MENVLFDASVRNDVGTLDQLLEEDSLILDKTTLNCQDKNPLHVAAMFGNVEFVRAVISACPDLCLAGDWLGRIPLHIAIIKGRLPVVQELVRARPLSARERIDGGGNSLHLCVKYNQLEALKFLLETVTDVDFINRTDDDGMTVLHLAVCGNQIATIEYLLQNNSVFVNVRNATGRTPLDLFQADSRNAGTAQILERAGAVRGRDIDLAMAEAENDRQEAFQRAAAHGSNDWLSKKKDAIMVVASLIATMAFQAGVNPAGGVWQEDDSNGLDPHVAGVAVMAHKHSTYYKYFIRMNTVAFVLSLSTILFLINGLPFRNKFFKWALMVIMWLTVSAIALTYGISIVMITPQNDKKQLSYVINTYVTIWCFVMSLLLFGKTLRLIRKCGVVLFATPRRGAMVTSRV